MSQPGVSFWLRKCGDPRIGNLYMTSSSFLRRRQSQWSITMWASKRSARSTKCMREHLRRQELHQMHKVLETGSLESSGKFALLLTRRKCSSSGWNAYMGKDIQFGYIDMFLPEFRKPWVVYIPWNFHLESWLVRYCPGTTSPCSTHSLATAAFFCLLFVLWDVMRLLCADQGDIFLISTEFDNVHYSTYICMNFIFLCIPWSPFSSSSSRCGV